MVCMSPVTTEGSLKTEEYNGSSSGPIDELDQQELSSRSINRSWEDYILSKNLLYKKGDVPAARSSNFLDWICFISVSRAKGNCHDFLN